MCPDNWAVPTNHIVAKQHEPVIFHREISPAITALP
jgi:hypothetical protein